MAFNSKSKSHFFYEDVVYCFNKKKLTLGIIDYVPAADSDSDSDSDSDLEKKKIEPGFISVSWSPNSVSQLISENKVKLLDRSLLPGDVVFYSDESKRNQLGYCIKSEITLSVKLVGSNKVSTNISSDRFEPTLSITVDVICVYKSWICTITDFTTSIKLLCNNKSVVIVSKENLINFRDITKRKVKDLENNFYIGQVLEGPLLSLQNGNWIFKSPEIINFFNSKSSKKCKIRVLVTDIKISSISVKKLYNILNDQSSPTCDENQIKLESNENSYIITDENLKFVQPLNVFHNCYHQLNEYGTIKIRESDTFIDYDEWKDLYANRLIEEKFFKNLELKENDIITEVNNLENNIDFDLQYYDVLDHFVEHFDNVNPNLNNFNGVKKLVSSNAPIGSIKKIQAKKLKHSRPKHQLLIDLSYGNKVPVQIISTETKVDILWQDSTITSNVPSYLFCPVDHVDANDFFPGDFVTENSEIVSSNEYGVVQEVNHVSRIARVKWFKKYDSKSVPTFVKENFLSVYDIKDHIKHQYEAGTCVAHLNSHDSLNFTKAGQVVSFSIDEKVTCQWADGTISQVYPEELFVIDNVSSVEIDIENDDENSSDFESIDDDSFKLYRPNDQDWNSKDQESNFSLSKNALFDLIQKFIAIKQDSSENEFSSCQIDKIVKKFVKSSASFNKEFDAIFSNEEGFHLLTSEFSKLSSSSKSFIFKKISKLLTSFLKKNLSNNTNNEEDIKELKLEDNEKILKIFESNFNDNQKNLHLLKNFKKYIQLFCKNCETSDEKCFHEFNQDEENKDELKINVHLNLVNDSQFNFQIIESVPESHFYKNSKLPHCAKLFRQISKEINILRNSLPLEIMVKTFEDRLDLYSIMIKGPKDTPYENGLFFFDILLPPSYPYVPPQVKYISYCTDRLNPNLYENGRVCVSLLGTWNGKGNENWNPNVSTLLQVLLSIQGLILVKEPYYNEEGYMSQKETNIGQENSRLYNEMVIIKLVQAMNKLYLYPNEIYKKEIQAHFKLNSQSILEKFEKWVLISEYWHKYCKNNSVKNLVQTLEESPFKANLNLPQFPLLPGSLGFCLSLTKALTNFKQSLPL